MRVPALGVTAGVAALNVISTALPALAQDAPRVEVERMLPILALPQSVQDRVPEDVDLGHLGNVSRESVRFLGEDDIADYWVGRSGNTQVCLIVKISGGNGVSASACASVTDFYRTGLGLGAGESVNGSEGSIEAYLLPADIDPIDLGAARHMKQAWQGRPDAHLLTVRPQVGSNWKGSEVERDNGISFRFTPISSKGR
ncbi:MULTISPECIES: hypothetical protein [unclassified Micromonospora]|uniref:hypothetical protein n=1 Tax=unclassified Micromonospora TaxID=2617518 RepID=UPI003A8AC58F